MITHYIPQWLLERFRPDSKPLLELNIFTRSIEPRKVRFSGSGADLWPEDIERELMGTHDNDASRVWRYRIKGKRRIMLQECERRTLALWAALFIPRVPETSEDFKKFVAAAVANPQEIVDVMYEDREAAFSHIRRHSPEAYEQITGVLGKKIGEEWLLASVARTIRERPKTFLPDPKTAYHNYLRSSDIDRFSKILATRYHWSWLYSRHGFVIGDNPLVRWHELSQRPKFGINRANVEITLPLGIHICLRLTQERQNDNGQLVFCTRKTTKEYNRRQRLASTGYVYSGDRQLLAEVSAPRLKNPKPSYRSKEGIVTP